MIDFDCQCNRIGGLPFLPCGGADTAGIVSQLTATCMPAEQCATTMRTSVRIPRISCQPSSPGFRASRPRQPSLLVLPAQDTLSGLLPRPRSPSAASRSG